MSKNQQNNFLDPKTLIALLMLGLAWVGWQTYMQKKYPDYYKKQPTQEATTEVKSGETTKPEEAHLQKKETSSINNPVKKDEVAVPIEVVEKTLPYSDKNISFILSSKGMGFKEVILNKYTNRKGEKYKFQKIGEIYPLETTLVGSNEPLDFNIEQIGPKSFVGTAYSGETKIVKVIEVHSEKYVFDTKISISNPNERFLGVKTVLVDEMADIEEKALMPTFERQEFFTINDGKEERVLLKKGESVNEIYPKTSVASLGTQYFSQSLVDESTIIPEFRIETADHKAIGILNYSLLNKAEDFTIAYKAFMGPKYLHILEGVNSQLVGLIDFGMFSWLAKPMLKLMKWFHQLVGNWGLAIIMLTLLVRVLVLPFTVMSYKSLNKMKVIQPQIAALKEKYKDDSQKLNQEMMQLMKTNKVNPLGGCLPMLLQFPVFIALYQVLGQSIELYQAPFFLWIHDLSLKDPYYVLPVLMAITMFVQQKITPNTMDPAQAKMMMFLPLVFALFMVSLPSGLTLYIFVSALFAIIQQLIFTRDTNQPAVVTA